MDQADAKDRIIERHVRWREHAIALLTDVVTTEPEKWPGIRDFLYRSNQRMVEASTDSGEDDRRVGAARPMVLGDIVPVIEWALYRGDPWPVLYAKDFGALP